MRVLLSSDNNLKTKFFSGKVISQLAIHVMLMSFVLVLSIGISPFEKYLLFTSSKPAIVEEMKSEVNTAIETHSKEIVEEHEQTDLFVSFVREISELAELLIFISYIFAAMISSMQCRLICQSLNPVLRHSSIRSIVKSSIHILLHGACGYLIIVFMSVFVTLIGLVSALEMTMSLYPGLTLTLPYQYALNSLASYSAVLTFNMLSLVAIPLLMFFYRTGYLNNQLIINRVLLGSGFTISVLIVGKQFSSSFTLVQNIVLGTLTTGLLSLFIAKLAVLVLDKLSKQKRFWLYTFHRAIQRTYSENKYRLSGIACGVFLYMFVSLLVSSSIELNSYPNLKSALQYAHVFDDVEMKLSLLSAIFVGNVSFAVWLVIEACSCKDKRCFNLMLSLGIPKLKCAKFISLNWLSVATISGVSGAICANALLVLIELKAYQFSWLTTLDLLSNAILTISLFGVLCSLPYFKVKPIELLDDFRLWQAVKSWRRS